MQDVESDEPQCADGERVEELGDGPVLERVAGEAQVISEILVRCANVLMLSAGAE